MASDNELVRILLIVVAVVVLIPVLLMALMMPMMGMWGWGHMADGGTWGAGMGGWLWPLTTLLTLAVLGVGGYLVYRAVRGAADEVADPAIEELRSAYARGDLTDEEFEQRRERLRRE